MADSSLIFNNWLWSKYFEKYIGNISRSCKKGFPYNFKSSFKWDKFLLPFSFKLETDNWEYKYEEYQYVLMSCLIFPENMDVVNGWKTDTMI
jgi:hypothetical protein